MSIYSRYKTDPVLESQTGVLLNYGPNSKKKDFCIRIRRAGGANDAYFKRMDARAKPQRKAIQSETIGREGIHDLLKDVYADTIVIGWENAEDENGNELAFNKENVLKIFADIPDIWEDVLEQSQRAALFRQQVLEEDAKN